MDSNKFDKDSPLGQKINSSDDFNWQSYSSNLSKGVDNPIFEDSEDIEVLTLEEDKEAKEKLTAVLTAEERKLKTESGFNKKTVLLIVLIATLIALAYATFAQALAHDGLFSSSSKSGVWDIGFIDMNKVSQKGQASEVSKPSYSKHEATFHVSLIEPGDEITYKLTIKNNGNLDARVANIVLVPENHPDDVILYYVSGLTVGDVLPAGKSTDMTVKARYSTTQGSVLATKTMQVVINYKQK